MNKLKLALRVIIPILISAALLYLPLRGSPVGLVLGAIARSDKGPLVAYLLVLLVIHLLRTVRWGILLEPLGHVGFKRLNSASAIGIMLLMVLPLRMGEFARPLLIARPPQGAGPRLRRSGAMASIVVERIADGLFMGLVGVLALHSVEGAYAAPARKVAVLVSLGFSALCVALGAAFFLREQAVGLTRLLLGKLSPRLAEKACSMLDAFIGALHLGSGFKVLGFFALTAIYWGCATFGLAVVAPAFGMKLTLLQGCAVLAMQVVGVMIPAGPGMVGTLQLATMFGLSFFYPFDPIRPVGEAGVNAVAYANTVWLLQFAQQSILGVFFMSTGHVSLRGLFGASAPDPTTDSGEGDDDAKAAPVAAGDPARPAAHP